MTGPGFSVNVRPTLGQSDHVVTQPVAALTAAALPPVADPAQPSRVQRVVLETNTDGPNDESVEHIRQSRLQRWQKQAG